MTDQTLRSRRLSAVLALAGTAFAIGAIVGASHASSAGQSLAARFVAAWARHDYAAMYLDVDAAARRSTSAGEFAALYEHALRTATAGTVVVAGKPRGLPHGLVAVPVRVRTRLFGTLALRFEMKVSQESAGSVIDWSPSLAFPGLRPGEELTRRMTLPRRATLLARDSSALAEGEATSAGERSSPLGESARDVVGEVGSVPEARRAELEAQGVPPEAIVGVSGVELALDEQLRGSPGGELLAEPAQGSPEASAEAAQGAATASQRVLAAAPSRPAAAVRSSVSPAIQRAAVAALGGQFGGIVAMQPSTGQILAVAGLGLDSLQPPGSTFKMVTVTGVLEAKLASRHTVFPYASYSTLDGVRLDNANGEECGGTLETAFAVSCNSVFAPLGVRLGAARLVATAERLGFNQGPGIPGASESTIPPASEIQGELDVGSTAIGQGQVQASPLEMALVAATIADGGRRPRPSFTNSSAPDSGPRVMSAGVARAVRRLMIDVVRFGTGAAAAIPGVTVAAKTGTAELKTQCSRLAGASPEAPPSQPPASSACATPTEAGGEAANTDAWFAAFAPALDPRIAVAVLLVKDGAGGATAAPVARQVLEAGLEALP